MIEDVKFIINSELETLKAKIIANHLSAKQKASGRTMKSITIEQGSNDVTLFGRKAFGTLETGRKSGKVPKGFYYIILQWAKDKKIKVDGSINTFAYFVAQKIAKEGTELYKSGGRKDIYSNVIPATIEAIKIKLTERFTKEIINIKIN